MTDFADSERRLRAALNRIDAALDRSRDKADAARPDPAELAGLRDENERLRTALDAAQNAAPDADLLAELQALRAEADETLRALRDENQTLRDRLAAAEAAPADPALEAALDAARAENRQLQEQLDAARAAADAASPDPALLAELEDLRAGRRDEISALDGIMSELERLTAPDVPYADAPYAEDVAPGSGDVLPFDRKDG